jgi:hypothetical protein
LLEADIKQNLKGCLCNLYSQYIVGIFLWGGCGVWGWVDNACLLMIYISGIGVHVCSFMYFEKCFELTISSFNIWTLFYIYAGLSWPWSYGSWIYK